MSPRRSSRDAEHEAADATFLDRTIAALTKRLESLATGGAKPAALPRDWLAAPDGGVTPPLLALRSAFDLSEFETAILALSVAHELDGAIGPLCASATHDPGRPWPTFALAFKLAAPAAWEAISGHGPLRFWRLIEVERTVGQPLALTPLRSDDRVLDFVKGLDRIDERLLQFVTLIEPPTTGEGPTDTDLHRMLAADAGPIMLYRGESKARADAAAAAAAAIGRQLYRIDARSLPATAAELDSFVRLWQRETRLQPLALLVDIRPDDPASEAMLQRFLAKLGLPILISSDRGLPVFLEGALPIAIDTPKTDAQHRAWAKALGRGRTDLATRLAASFDLGEDGIQRIVASGVGDDDDAIWRLCIANVRPRLDSLAQRIDPRADWDDLVLADAQRAILHQIADQVRLRRRVYDEWGYRAKTSRGLGVNALFAGESGTGKTMAAEVLARELALNLYRIDLSQVVSKYIGETEENLGQLFDAAERGGVILLFDEADALFGKRSEIKDSHDRYANIEVNYLLQRIESFTGLAILATNMKASLDGAFLRRMRFLVQFSHPGPAERIALWRKAFPAAAPIEALRYEQLARINLTGGNIASAAMNAAFLAAAEGTPVRMAHVLRAARAELTKLSRPINEADFIAPAALAGAA